MHGILKKMKIIIVIIQQTKIKMKKKILGEKIQVKNIIIMIKAEIQIMIKTEIQIMIGEIEKIKNKKEIIMKIMIMMMMINMKNRKYIFVIYLNINLMKI